MIVFALAFLTDASSMNQQTQNMDQQHSVPLQSVAQQKLKK